MRRDRGFTLIEVLVVVSIIGLLVAILTPSLKAARRVSRQTHCLSNLKQIGVGVKGYLSAHRETLPHIDALPSTPSDPPLPGMVEAFKKELGGESDLFKCPADRNTEGPPVMTDRYWESEGTSYEWAERFNGARVHFNRIEMFNGIIIQRPDEAVLANDFETTFHAQPHDERGAVNYLYADSHVASR